MGVHVETMLGYEAHEDGEQIRLKKDGVTVMLPGPGPDLQEVLDSIILCADAIAKRRNRELRFKSVERPAERGCGHGRREEGAG